MSERVGYTEESAGVRSSTRLIAICLTALVAVLVGTIAVYVLRLGKDASAMIVTALGGVVATVGVSCLVAIVKRDCGDAHVEQAPGGDA